MSDYLSADKVSILERICQAGISGLGGAGFPTHIKTNPQKSVECLIINGIECEPYISSDDRIMREHAWQIKQGIDILRHVIQPKQVIIAVEDNKPEAMDAIKTACIEDAGITIASVPTKYPAGGERQLIQVLTGEEVPQEGLPIDVGCLMYNVGTCYAIADAVLYWLVNTLNSAHKVSKLTISNKLVFCVIPPTFPFLCKTTPETGDVIL